MADETTPIARGTDTEAVRSQAVDREGALLASRVLSGDEAVDELVAFARELQHEVLRLRDELIGANAAADAVRERMARLERTDVGAAVARVDELEDQKEALRALLNANSVKAEAEKKELRESTGLQLAAMRRSATWRLGSIVLLPTRVRRRGQAK